VGYRTTFKIGSEKMDNNNTEIVEMALKTGRWSNTIDHELLFSIVNNRFVKGTTHKGLNWGIEYRIYSGNYVLLRIHGYTNDRGVDLEVQKVKIDRSGYETIEKYFDERVVLGDLLKYIEINNNTPKILKDFMNSIPQGYHSIGSIPIDEKYSEKIEDTVNFMNKYIETITEM